MLSVRLNINPHGGRLYFKGNNAEEIIKQGDDLLNNNKPQEALEAYKKAQAQSPDNAVISAKIGKAYFKLKDYKSASESFEKYLEKNPDDTEYIMELGEAQRMAGYYEKAIQTFEKAYNQDNSNDFAGRKILETKNNLLSIYNPQRAVNEKNEYAVQNLKKALNMAVGYMTPEYMSDLRNLTVEFGKTSEMGGTANIAQYEDGRKTITVSDEYIYAAPQVIAAYLSHEAVHAKDADAYTSIREEQDAYKAAAQFWIKNSGKIKDPEMDYAVSLYKKSPNDLDKRVEEIYKLRDPAIARTSPNHPPEQKGRHFLKKTKPASSQPLNKYEIIA